MLVGRGRGIEKLVTGGKSGCCLQGVVKILVDVGRGIRVWPVGRPVEEGDGSSVTGWIESAIESIDQ